MSGANTDLESLQRIAGAALSFQYETATLARGTGLALDDFENEVEGCRRKLVERLEDEIHSRRGRHDRNDELEQMLYESDLERRKVASLEERCEELDRLYARYQMDRDSMADQLRRLLMGDAMSGDMHGLREVCRLLQDYLEQR